MHIKWYFSLSSKILKGSYIDCFYRVMQEIRNWIPEEQFIYSALKVKSVYYSYIISEKELIGCFDRSWDVNDWSEIIVWYDEKLKQWNSFMNSKHGGCICYREISKYFLFIIFWRTLFLEKNFIVIQTQLSNLKPIHRQTDRPPERS